MTRGLVAENIVVQQRRVLVSSMWRREERAAARRGAAGVGWGADVMLESVFLISKL